MAAAAAILCPLLVVAFAAAGTNSSNANNDADQPANASQSNQTPLTVSASKQPTCITSVPFFYVPSIKPNCDISTEPPFADLLRSLDTFRTDTSSFLASMTRMHEVARRSEWVIYGDRGDIPDNPLLAAGLRDKISWTAEILERDMSTLEGLMKPFAVTVGLPSPSVHAQGENDGDGMSASNYGAINACAEDNERRYTSMPGRRRANDDDSISYNSSAQVITHIVRDWTSSGSRIRHSLYDWCIDMLRKHPQNSGLPVLPVLVPGSGLGRLAYEISRAGFSVEANDVSISMAAVAYQFLNGHVQKGILHPFCFDFLINEIDSERRYDSISFPDVDVSVDSDYKCFSYTLGDFVHTYASPQRQGHYGAVVTCFFIDTATNIYEYLAIIRSVLCSGGVWINVGPVQWHANALVQPSGDELKVLIGGFGFNILSWAVDSETVNYRHDEDSNVRYTKAEAYLPIRFVARKESGSSAGREDIDRIIRELREATMPIYGSTAYTDNKKQAETPVADNKPNEDKNNEDENDCGGFVFVDSDEEVDVVIEEVS